MSTLARSAAALAEGTIEVIDLTAPVGAVVIAIPPPVVGGPGSPARVLAMVDQPPPNAQGTGGTQ